MKKFYFIWFGLCLILLLALGYIYLYPPLFKPCVIPGENVGRITPDECRTKIKEVAIKSKDPAMCEGIKYRYISIGGPATGDIQAECFAAVAVTLKDTTICRKILSLEYGGNPSMDECTKLVNQGKYYR
jgi:hypothetical protein